jgi:hypothetical protein
MLVARCTVGAAVTVAVADAAELDGATDVDVGSR